MIIINITILKILFLINSMVIIIFIITSYISKIKALIIRMVKLLTPFLLALKL